MSVQWLQTPIEREKKKKIQNQEHRNKYNYTIKWRLGKKQ